MKKIKLQPDFLDFIKLCNLHEVKYLTVVVLQLAFTVFHVTQKIWMFALK